MSCVLCLSGLRSKVRVVPLHGLAHLKTEKLSRIRSRLHQSINGQLSPFPKTKTKKRYKVLARNSDDRDPLIYNSYFNTISGYIPTMTFRVVQSIMYRADPQRDLPVRASRSLTFVYFEREKPRKKFSRTSRSSR